MLFALRVRFTFGQFRSPNLGSPAVEMTNGARVRDGSENPFAEFTKQKIIAYSPTA